MNLLNNLFLIISSPWLIISLIIYAYLGSIFFYYSIRLCSLKGVINKTVKYITTTLSIIYLSNFFIILVTPLLYYSISNFYSLWKVYLVSIVVGMILYEWLSTHTNNIINNNF